MKRSIDDVIWGTVPVFAWRLGKTTKIFGCWYQIFRTEIWNSGIS